MADFARCARRSRRRPPPNRRWRERLTARGDGVVRERDTRRGHFTHVCAFDVASPHAAHRGVDTGRGLAWCQHQHVRFFDQKPVGRFSWRSRALGAGPGLRPPLACRHARRCRGGTGAAACIMQRVRAVRKSAGAGLVGADLSPSGSSQTIFGAGSGLACRNFSAALDRRMGTLRRSTAGSKSNSLDEDDIIAGGKGAARNKRSSRPATTRSIPTSARPRGRFDDRLQAHVPLC